MQYLQDKQTVYTDTFTQMSTNVPWKRTIVIPTQSAPIRLDLLPVPVILVTKETE